MFTTGGGAESSDGSGGFVTGAAALEYRMEKVSFGLGGQYSYISTGIIQGSSPYLTLRLHQEMKQLKNPIREASLFINPMWSPYNEHGRTTGFIGVGGRIFNDNLYTSVYLGAAVTDLGGYMDVYGGFGKRFDLGPIRFMGEFNLGTGGGGRAPDGGGGLVGGQIECQLPVTNNYIGLAVGGLHSIDAPFYYGFASLRVGTEFIFAANGSNIEGMKPVNLVMESSVRSYLGTSGFSNLGVAFQLYKYKSLILRGESYWAMTDGRGAYAEGLFGLRYQPGMFYVEGQIGAGAGGGINLWGGAGLIFMNTGLDIPIGESYSLNIKGLYNVYSTTAFPKYGIQFGIGYKIPFVIK
jgi:hypothetical protein